MERRRVAGAVATAIVLVATAVSGLAAPAAATPVNDTVLVSSDGVHFAAQLPAPLFSSFGLLVPLESQHVAMWIKNNSEIPATMRVGVNDLLVPSEVFARGVTLSTTGQRSEFDQSWTIGELNKCKTVIPTATMKPGEVVKVDVTISMLDLDGLEAQTESAELDLTVKMTDARGGTYSADPCDDRIIGTNGGDTPTSPDPNDPASPDNTDEASDGSLPFTGQSIRTDLIIAAGVLVGIGWFLLAKRRRREEDADDATLES